MRASQRTDAAQAAASRIYDWFLGGRDNYEVDRIAGRAFLDVVPNAQNSARATRGFALRAARFMADQGIDQFLDIGAGIPTTPNVHEIVRRIHPEGRVVYVDNDPIAVSKGEMLREERGVITVEGDLRNPAAILRHPDVKDLLDLGRPVAVLTVAVWHFIPSDGAVARAQSELRDGLAPGSLLALSHGCTENLSDDMVKRAEELYRHTSNPMKARSREEIMRLFDGFDLVEPDLVPLHEWHPYSGDPYPQKSPEALAGLGVRQ